MSILGKVEYSGFLKEGICSVQSHRVPLPLCVRGSREDMMAAAAANSHSGMSTSQSAILVDDPEAWRSTWTSRVTRNSYHHHRCHLFNHPTCWCWSGHVFTPGHEHSFSCTALPRPLASGGVWPFQQKGKILTDSLSFLIHLPSWFFYFFPHSSHLFCLDSAEVNEFHDLCSDHILHFG